MAQDDVSQKPNYYIRTLLLIIALLISFSAYTIWRNFAGNRTKFEEYVICSMEDCGHLFKLEHRADEKPPFTCPKCGNKSAYKAYHCLKCDLYFPNIYLNTPDNVICPKCGYGTPIEEVLNARFNESLEKKPNVK